MENQTTKRDLGLYLQVFSPLLNKLNELSDKGDWRNAIVIAGSHALQKHGLVLPREPQDLDIAIYRINEKQWDFLRSIRLFAIGSYNAGFHDIKACKALMFKKQGLLLNLLLHPDDNAPFDLLEYNFGGIHFLVQSIDNVIAAKNSYRLNPHSTAVTGMRYARIKDYYDCQELKNRNFNVPLDGDTAPQSEEEYNF